MKRTYESGSQKRKEKKRKDDEAARSSKNLNAWLTASTSQTKDQDLCETVNQPTQSESELKKPCQVEDEIKITGRELETCHNESHEELHSTENSTKLINEQGQIEVRVTHELEDALNVSLCDVLPKTVNESELKRKLVRDGPYQPEGPFPRDRQGRCFSSHYYSFTTNAGIKLKRNWLCYSKSNDCVYCLPCWLFPQDVLVTGINLSNLFSKNGVRDWKHISERIASHEGPKVHS
ncbi:zinc finger MYM-type protein 5-like [Diabrotica virgifera virgifera]|uniref:Zinc finger MYM-type protein 5-like n=1 Tax=Diabrotica virgifera virgifera TaxID=50390 RepID=A0ABM5LA63_DIAVI|nr:zinc finger MYM-type protein 5-like [Diabrotica virgifera virgifera]